MNSGGPKDPTQPSSSDVSSAEVHGAEAYCSACNQSFPSDTKVCPNDGARLIVLAAERDELIGRVLDARYEIRSPLGQGGMGTVYRGWQLSVDREVAIKVIHPKLSNDRSAVKRFLREARLASRLSQPNIVNVYDFGQSEGVLYLVMELLRGHTLSSELGHARRINAKRTVGIALQLCDALEAAHAQGIVHRDLKPSNIVILDDPPGRDLLKVLDFGLAKSLVQDSGSVVTNTDALLGTPLYMAPEQIEGVVSDQRADLYSFGCILYEMLTGKPPFVDGAVSVVLARHMHDVHTPLPQHVPVKLRALVDRLLAKKADDRFQAAGEVRRVLDDMRESIPAVGEGATPLAIQVPEVPDTVPDVAAFAETMATPQVGIYTRVTDETPAPTPGGAKPRRYAIVAFLAIIPLAMIAFVLVTSQHRDTATPEPARDQVEHVGTPDQAVTAGSGSAQPVVEQAPPPADVGIDHAAVSEAVPDVTVPVDAGVKVKKQDRHERKTVRVRPDAGAPSLPDIDFIDVNKR